MNKGFAPIVVFIIVAVVIGVGGYFVFVQQGEPAQPMGETVPPVEESAQPENEPAQPIEEIAQPVVPAVDKTETDKKEQPTLLKTSTGRACDKLEGVFVLHPIKNQDKEVMNEYLSEHPVKCDINENYQLLVRHISPLRLFLNNKQSEEEYFILELEETSILGGSKYDPAIFYKITDGNLLDIYYNPPCYHCAFNRHFLIDIKTGNTVLTYDVGIGGNSISVSRENLMWDIKLAQETEKQNIKMDGRSGMLISAQVTGITVNDKIVVPLNISKSYEFYYIGETDRPYNIAHFGNFEWKHEDIERTDGSILESFAYIIDNVQFTNDFTKIKFNAELIFQHRTIGEVDRGGGKSSIGVKLNPEVIELGEIEIELDPSIAKTF